MADLLKVVIKVVDGRLAVEAKVGNPALLHDEDTVKQVEGVGRRAVDGSADGDSPSQQ